MNIYLWNVSARHTQTSRIDVWISTIFKFFSYINSSLCFRRHLLSLQEPRGVCLWWMDSLFWASYCWFKRKSFTPRMAWGWV